MSFYNVFLENSVFQGFMNELETILNNKWFFIKLGNINVPIEWVFIKEALMINFSWNLLQN